MYYVRLDSFSRDYPIQKYGLKGVIQPVICSQTNYFIQESPCCEIIGEDHTVPTDAKWVTFIFNQLLSNAIKYTPDHGNIMVSVKKEAQGVSLSVKDSGTGILEEDLKRTFNKGFTGRNGRLSKTRSAGLDLYLAKNLAEELGIQLTAESTGGKGTITTLFFPILDFCNEKR